MRHNLLYISLDRPLRHEATGPDWVSAGHARHPQRMQCRARDALTQEHARVCMTGQATKDGTASEHAPMHLRRPPPKGRYAKLWVTSVGVGPSTGKRSGRKSLGRSHMAGERCRFQTEMNRSLPAATCRRVGVQVKGQASAQ